MKISAIKKLVEQYSLEQCVQAESDLCEGNTTSIQIDGDDEGEQLTHVLAAIDIHQRIQLENKDMKTAIREFSERVRSSIS